MVAVPGVRDSRVEWQPACVGLRRETMGRGVASVSAPGLPIDCSLAERLLSESGLFAAEMMGNLVHRRLAVVFRLRMRRPGRGQVGESHVLGIVSLAYLQIGKQAGECAYVRVIFTKMCLNGDRPSQGVTDRAFGC